MKKFRITVNGKAYEVEVEEMAGMLSAAPAAAPRPAPKAATTPRTITRSSKPAPVAVAPEPKPVSVSKPVETAKPLLGKGEAVRAPMPGTILEIKVALEQEVKEGATLIVLEAMKMENEIYAPSSGRISEIPVNKGDSVNSGDVLVVIE